MDTTYSGAEVARRLGTSIPRVVRGAERLGLSCRASNGRLRISSKMLRQLEAELGRTPRVPSLTPPQAQVLAALRRAPLGLSSARVVARRAGISPSGASAALKALEARGLVRRESKKIAAGRVRRVELLHANRLAPEWTALTPYLKDVCPKARALRRDKVVPYRLQHLFWNTAPSQLVVSHAGPYIARRLLTSFSYAGLSWGAENLKASDWRTAAKGRGLDPPTRALALNLAERETGRAKGDPQQSPNARVPRGGARLEASELPEQVARVLPRGTAQAWLVLRKLLPEDLYLIGGTAIAVHLGHRKSQDLEFIFHEEKVDLVALSKALGKLSDFAVERESPGALRGFLGKAKVEFFHADEDPERTQRILEPPEEVAGLRVASLKDLAAMKLKALRDRHEMRDYFDLKQLEEEAEVTVEDALVFFMERYGVSAEHEAVPQIICCLGFMDDVQEDEAQPISKKLLAAWWQRRQKVLIRGLGITPP